MADEYTQQQQSRGKSRRERVEYARSRDILDVANELNMELFREGRDYRWKEHDSLVITPDKNVWNWFSRHQGGDVISLVEVMKEVDFNQAINFLNDGSFKERTVVERVQEPFSYYLAPYEQPFEAARNYLQSQRGLSAETIDFFLEKGVLAQANAKVKGSIEPVIVFKSFDFSGEIVGATLQGIEENWEKWTDRGYAKNIMRNSDGLTGLHVDIGQPNHLIFAESAIDLMSYYELHKDSLQDVRLVSMDGLKEGVIGRHLAQLQSELSGRPLNWNYEQLAEGLQIAIDRNFFTDGKHSDWITLAVDNDEGGQNFVSSLREKGAVVNEALPDLQPGQVKTDWNDYLKQVKDVKKQTANEEPSASFDNLSEEVTSSKTAEQEPDFDGFTTVSRIIIDDRTWNKSDPSKEISGTVVKVDAALISDIYPGYSVLFKYDNKTSINGTVYLGKRSRYDNKGNYDNRDNSLIVVSQNHAMLYLLESGELEHAREEMIEKGIHTDEDYQEFDQIVERLAKDYQMMKVDISEQKTDVEVTEMPTSRKITYDNLKNENEALVGRLENRIKSGDLSVQFADDVYFYDVFYKTGNSHPMKSLTDKRLELLKPTRAILESITDRNVDLYKEKGTPEQDALYQAIQPNKRALGIGDVSTRFIGELAISAYNTNKQLVSLQAETFGVNYRQQTLDVLSQSIEHILEYPLNDLGINDFTYGFVTIPNAFYHYLDEQTGEVIISRDTLQTLMTRLQEHPVQVIEEDGTKEKAPDVNQTQEKSLDNNQETNTGGELFNRSSSFLGENSPGTAPQPVEPIAQPDFPTNVPLYFNIDKDIKSSFRLRKGYHYPKNKDVRNISAYAEDIQKSATWYLNELADTTVTYFYKDGTKQQALQVKFEKRHWMHLTGIAPVYSEKLDSVSETFIDEISSGHTSFQNVTVGPGYLDKIQILPMLSEVLETDSFVFDDLSSIEKFGRLDAESAIRSEDKSVVLAFQTDSQDEMFPASLLKPGLDLNIQMDTLSQEKTILGVLIEKDGDIRVHRINADYIKDNGAEMVEFLNSQRSNATQWTQSLPDEQIKESEPSVMDSNVELEVSAEDFTKVLDAVYNVGVPDDLARVPEEVLLAWQKYLEVSEENQWGLEQMVDYADKNGLLVKDSAFYKEWQEDMIYKNDYHVRLQFAENWDNGVELPFSTEQLIDYKTFVAGLYEANQAHYQRSQENQLPYTKTEFDIYAPGGQLIKDNVHYAIGDETRPVSQLMGLGYRRLPGYQDLAAIDEIVLSQLENQELNQEIAAEANEQPLDLQEISQEDSRPREAFASPKQDIKAGLAQRVEEIMAEDAKKQLEVAAPRVQEDLSMEGDLVATPQADGSVLYTNREDFGQGYQIELTVYSPERVDNLSEMTAPWSIALLRGEEKLGYLAYGSDWVNDFQIEEELEKLAEAVKANKLPDELYQQEEVDTFLASSTGQGKHQETTVSTEPFDYNTASAYEISERAFQKIREYTQSPEDFKAYMDFMSKFPRLSPRNVALIQEQWRGANAVATYNQWQSLGETLGIKPEDVIQTKAIYTNKRTGETQEVVHQNLSVKTGEKAQITLFRPVLVKMIPVLDESGHQLKNAKGNPKYKKLSEATPQEKNWIKEGKLSVRQFQERDFQTGQPKYTTYKVFELSQTTLKPESYPKAMPNRHYNFNMDKVKTKEVLEGLCDYADSIGVSIMKDEVHALKNAKGAFYPDDQLILINPSNTSGEKIATTIHELAHATLHNPKLAEQYKELPKGQMEFEAEMTSHLLSKHFGLDTSEKAIQYMAGWTNNLKALDDKQLANSLGRVHKTVSKMLKQVESHTKPYQGKSLRQAPNFPKAPSKGMSR